MHWFFLSYFCMLQVIEAYPPTNHGVMTSLLAGARVHRLDCAHGSIELASPSRAHGGWSEVWLPACQQGGATNRAWQRWHDPVGAVVHHFCKERLWGMDDVVRRSLPLGLHHVLTSTAWRTNKPKCIVASPFYFAASCTSQQGIPLSSCLLAWGLNKLELHLCLGIVESMLYVVLLTSRAGPYISGAWGKTKFWALTQKILSI
jgi:hypothetical protein